MRRKVWQSRSQPPTISGCITLDDTAGGLQGRPCRQCPDNGAVPMNNDLILTLIFAAVAAFVLFKLRSVLGRREGHEQRPPEIFAEAERSTRRPTPSCRRPGGPRPRSGRCRPGFAGCGRRPPNQGGGWQFRSRRLYRGGDSGFRDDCRGVRPGRPRRPATAARAECVRQFRSRHRRARTGRRNSGNHHRRAQSRPR